MKCFSKRRSGVSKRSSWCVRTSKMGNQRSEETLSPDIHTTLKDAAMNTRSDFLGSSLNCISTNICCDASAVVRSETTSNTDFKRTSSETVSVLALNEAIDGLARVDDDGSTFVSCQSGFDSCADSTCDSEMDHTPEWTGAEEGDVQRADLAENGEVQGLTPSNRHLFESALEKCLIFPRTWRVGYSSPVTEVVYDFEPGSSHAWVHGVRHLLNCTLADALCGTNEISQWPKWHPTVHKISHVGPVDKYGHGVHAHNRVLLIRSDINCRITRFLYNGMIVESATSVDPADDDYYVPARGTRTVVSSFVIYVQTTMGVLMMSRMRVELPFRLPLFVVNWFMRFFCPNIARDFQKLVETVQDDKKPYKAFMTEDKTGVYAATNDMASKFPDIRLTNWRDWTMLRKLITSVALPDGPMHINQLNSELES